MGAPGMVPVREDGGPGVGRGHRSWPATHLCRDSDGAGTEDLVTVACAGWGRGSLSGLVSISALLAKESSSRPSRRPSTRGDS